MPGVLIVEALAQAAGILAVKTHDGDVRQENALYFFVGIDNCRFKRQVIPGDQLTLEVEMLRVARGIGKFRAVAKVDGEIAAEADLMCAPGGVPWRFIPPPLLRRAHRLTPAWRLALTR